MYIDVDDVIPIIMTSSTSIDLSDEYVDFKINPCDIVTWITMTHCDVVFLRI